MPKSKKRGGEKAHRKRVVARNQSTTGTLKRLQKFIFDIPKELEQEQSASTEDNVIIDKPKYDVRTGKQFYFKKTNNE